MNRNTYTKGEMMTDLARCQREQAEAARYLTDDAACAEWAARYGCTAEQARDGAVQAIEDWLMEECLCRLEESCKPHVDFS